MKKSIRIILIAVFILSAAGFLYTFVQPRFTGTIVSVGRATSVTTSSKHGTKSHTVVPLQVKYTDGGEERIVEVRYAYPPAGLSKGQEIVFVQSFNGFIPYPFWGLRAFCGIVGGALLLFQLFTLLERRKPGKESDLHCPEADRRGET